MNCWEFKQCGRDKTKDCPAYPNRGKDCWKVAGTMCGGKPQGSFARKLISCMYCEFYKANNRINTDDYTEEWFLKGVLIDLAELIDNLIIPYTSTSRIGTRLADQVYYKLKSQGKNKITTTEYADYIVDISNKLGGNFKVLDYSNDSVTIASSKCIFGDRPSHTLCKIISGIYGGLSVHCFGYGKVVLEKTIAEGSKSCEIKIYSKRTKASDEHVGLEFTKELSSLQMGKEDANKNDSGRQLPLKEQIIGICGNLVASVNENNPELTLSGFKSDLANVPGIDMAALYLKEPETECFELRGYFGLDEDIIEKVQCIKTLHRENGENDKQFNNRQLKLIASFDSERGLLEKARMLSSFATIPLINHGMLIGALNIASRRQEPISVEESNLLRDICNLLAVILENYSLRSRITNDFVKVVTELDWIRTKLSEYEKSEVDQSTILIRLLLDKAGISERELKRLCLANTEVA